MLEEIQKKKTEEISGYRAKVAVRMLIDLSRKITDELSESEFKFVFFNDVDGNMTDIGTITDGSVPDGPLFVSLQKKRNWLLDAYDVYDVYKDFFGFRFLPEDDDTVFVSVMFFAADRPKKRKIKFRELEPFRDLVEKLENMIFGRDLFSLSDFAAISRGIGAELV